MILLPTNCNHSHCLLACAINHGHILNQQEKRVSIVSWCHLLWWHCLFICFQFFKGYFWPQLHECLLYIIKSITGGLSIQRKHKVYSGIQIDNSIIKSVKFYLWFKNGLIINGCIHGMSMQNLLKKKHSSILHLWRDSFWNQLLTSILFPNSVPQQMNCSLFTIRFIHNVLI